MIVSSDGFLFTSIWVSMGLKTSRIDKPIFLIDINSLWLIKFLNKKETDRIITNGIISEVTDGIFKKIKYKKFDFELSIILDISSALINKTIIVINNKFKKIYLLDKLNIY